MNLPRILFHLFHKTWQFFSDHVLNWINFSWWKAISTYCSLAESPSLLALSLSPSSLLLHLPHPYHYLSVLYSSSLSLMVLLFLYCTLFLLYVFLVWPVSQICIQSPVTCHFFISVHSCQLFRTVFISSLPVSLFPCYLFLSPSNFSDLIFFFLVSPNFRIFTCFCSLSIHFSQHVGCRVAYRNNLLKLKGRLVCFAWVSYSSCLFWWIVLVLCRLKSSLASYFQHCPIFL